MVSNKKLNNFFNNISIFQNQPVFNSVSPARGTPSSLQGTRGRLFLQFLSSLVVTKLFLSNLKLTCKA